MTTSTRLMASFVAAEPVAGAEAIAVGEREGKGKKQLSFFFLSLGLIDGGRNSAFQNSLGCRRKKRNRL